MTTSFQITIDCIDPPRLAAFWALALNYRVEVIPREWLEAQKVPEELWNSRAAIVDPQGVGPRLWFQQVAEPKTGKNRLHLDLRVAEGRVPPDEQRARASAKAELLIAAGATRQYEMTEYGQYWITLADLEGNEFCIG